MPRALLLQPLSQEEPINYQADSSKFRTNFLLTQFVDSIPMPQVKSYVTWNSFKWGNLINPYDLYNDNQTLNRYKVKMQDI